MSNQHLFAALSQVASLAQTTRLKRFLNNPFKYAYAIFIKEILYPVTQKEQTIFCNLFTGKKIKILLPASTDIYLTGGKSHPSEIRLAKFLMHNLQFGNMFWDIGAHYGYFSLIAAELVGKTGRVISFEAADTTYNILKANSLSATNINAIHKAVADTNDKISFYELPNLYSEYNSTDIAQFENEEWFRKINAKKTTLDAISLDRLLHETEKSPNIIKIDVEGGEKAVIAGGEKLFSENAPVVIMEYLEPKRNNLPHQQAATHLLSFGYQPFIIDDDGTLQSITNIDEHLQNQQLESDNIVFKK
jgi:FkbM family methyltransferase